METHMFVLTFAELLQFVLASYGLTFMLKDALLFRRFREWLTGDSREAAHAANLAEVLEDLDGAEPETETEPFGKTWLENFLSDLFRCSFCVGTWSGIFLALWALRAQGDPTFDTASVGLVMSWALMSAVVGFVGDLVTQILEGTNG
jgi:hypothetical protein